MLALVLWVIPPSVHGRMTIDTAARTFLSPPELDLLRLAPAGNKVAGIEYRQQRYRLVVIPQQNGRQRTVAHKFEQGTPVGVLWANDRRLMVRVQFGDSEGWLAVDEDGGHARWVVPRQQGSATPLHLLSAQPAHILVALDDVRTGLSNVVRLDLYTGQQTLVESNPGQVFKWVIDQRGDARAALAWNVSDDGAVEYRLRHRSAVDQPWQTLYQWRLGGAAINPLRFDVDNHHLLVTESLSGDAARLSRLDPDQPLTPMLLSEIDGADIERVVYDRSGHAVLTVGGRSRSVNHRVNDRFDRWLSPFEQAMTPNRVDVVDVGPEQALVLVTGDRNPGRYYVLDLESGRAQTLAHRHPSLRWTAMAALEETSISTEDGEQLSAYVMRAPGHSRGAVVMPHGGPWSRDQWRYDPVAQYLASQGYDSIRVNYRGSQGFGRRFLNAGRHQWSGKVLDDIESARRWAIEQLESAQQYGVCVFGMSFGGYAALMSAARNEQWRCAGSFAGLMDISLQMDALQARGNHRGHAEWAWMVGVDRTSPLAEVETIEQPVFMAWGELDQRVSPQQSKQMVRRLQTAGSNVEKLTLPASGHIPHAGEARIALYSALVRFLGRHLEPAQASGGGIAAPAAE